MGILDKIKNALFEEEYVEVEEKPKKVKKDFVKNKSISKDNRIDEKPIAKKVVLPEKKDVRADDIYEEELLDEDFEVKPSSYKEEKEEKNNFKVMEDKDFKVDEEVSYPEVEPKIVKVIDKEEPVYHREAYSKPKEKQPYGISDNDVPSIHEYGRAYDRKDEKVQFKPSPIISPIYGILDKNYRKEDVVTKREVRLTSSYARENLSVDDVRNKAYGSLSDDLAREFEDKSDSRSDEVSFQVEDEEENLLVDLSKDDDKPEVKEVTVGDALEYFQDLGLEYNVDYVDSTKERATGRRVKDNYDEEVEQTKEEAPKKEESKKDENKKEEITSNDVDVDSDDNLFDLIDSMYKEED